MNKGFTIIELIVAITIIAVLSGIIVVGAGQYVNKAKDSSIAGNLSILVPAGEAFYNGNGDSYQGFCGSSIVANTFSQIPAGVVHNCNENSSNNYQSWAACAQLFSNPAKIYCVDSRGVKEEASGLCDGTITVCP